MDCVQVICVPELSVAISMLLLATCIHIHTRTQVAFAAADSVTGLKLIEAGLPSERIALMAVPLVPVQIVLPWVIRYTHTHTLMSHCLR